MKRLLLIGLMLSVGVRALAVLPGSLVWEVRADGNAANGGGFNTASGSTDYTKQASAQWSGTDGTTTASTTFTSATANFNTNVVGHIIRISAGTGATTGYYEIVGYTSATTITLDAVSGTTLNATFKIGGALAAIGNVGSASANQGMVAGNLMCVKAGSYTVAATDTVACSGTATSPIRIVGYNTVRPTLTTVGDGYLGRTGSNLNKTLDTSNMPLYAYGSVGLAGSSSTFVVVETIKFTSSIAGNAVVIGGKSFIKSCYASTSSTSASSIAISATGAGGNVIDCDAFLTAASGAASGAGINIGVGIALGNHVSCGTTTAPGIKLSGFGASAVIDNVVYSGGGVGIYVSTINACGNIVGNTIYGCTDGVNIISANVASPVVIANNCITDNSGYGINIVSAANACVLYGNRTRDNASGAINSGTDWVNASNWLSVTTDTGGASTDYVDAAGGDWRLISASPAAGAGVPKSKSMGFSEPAASAGGQRSYTFGN